MPGPGPKRRLSALLLIVTALALVGAGCGDDDEDVDTGAATTEATETATETATDTAAGGDGAAGAVEVAMSEYEFDPSTFEVARGDTISVTNVGGIVHNLTVNDEVATEDVQPSGATELTVDLAPGEYEFVCTIGNHAELGMTGTLTVE